MVTQTRDRSGPTSNTQLVSQSLVPRVLQRVARGFAAVMILGLAIAATGAAYEAIASTQDAVRYPRPGRMVDVGGHRLHIDCSGQGTPTVVLDAGAGEVGSLAWGSVPTEIATRNRVCTYDRAGFGWSEPGPLPRSTGQMVTELRALLTAAGEPGPYVLVGHSLGGKNVRLFAGRYPADVAAVVLVDARHEDYDVSIGAEAVELENAQTEQFRSLQVALRRFGVTRGIGPWLLSNAPPEVGGLPIEYFLLQGQPGSAEANSSENRSKVESNAQLRAEAGSLGSLPLVVLVRGIPEPNAAEWASWQDAQRTMAASSSRGQFIVADQSGHAIQLEQPDLVIAAIRLVSQLDHQGVGS
jgi:pimeloyl-ACP methyl ester carboxylesterase